MQVPAARLSIVDGSGASVPGATIRYSFSDASEQTIACGPMAPTDVTLAYPSCEFVDIDVDGGRTAGQLSIAIEAFGFAPTERELDVPSDGCLFETVEASVEVVRDDDAAAAVCSSYCSTDVDCDESADWTVSECRDSCLEEQTGDEASEDCVINYLFLYDCLGALECDDYLDYVYGNGDGICEDTIQAIDDCESG